MKLKRPIDESRGWRDQEDSRLWKPRRPLSDLPNEQPDIERLRSKKADSTTVDDELATKVPDTRQVLAGTGLTGGGDLTVDRTLSVEDNTTTQKIEVDKAGTLIGTRKAINLIEGTSITLTMADDGANDRVNITVDAVATAPAGSDTQVQFNNAGAFGASANLTLDATKLAVGLPTRGPNGSGAAPSFSFTGLTNAGMYTDGTRVIFSQGGNAQIGMNSGFISIGSNILAGSSTVTGSSDCRFQRDAAGIWAMHQGGSPAGLRVYGFTNGNPAGNGTNYIRCRFEAIVTPVSAFVLRTESQGTGLPQSIRLGTVGIDRWEVMTSGHLTAIADNTYDIGASGATRPRTGYFGTSVVSPVAVLTGATPTVSAGQVGLGNDTQTTVGVAGAADAPPVAPTGYLKVNIGGTDYVIPYYAAS